MAELSDQGVAFLPAVQRANLQPRRFFQAGQRDIAAVELMPNLPEPYDLIDWREKARAYMKTMPAWRDAAI